MTRLVLVLGCLLLGLAAGLPAARAAHVADGVVAGPATTASVALVSPNDGLPDGPDRPGAHKSCCHAHAAPAQAMAHAADRIGVYRPTPTNPRRAPPSPPPVSAGPLRPPIG